MRQQNWAKSVKFLPFSISLTNYLGCSDFYFEAEMKRIERFISLRINTNLKYILKIIYDYGLSSGIIKWFPLRHFLSSWGLKLEYNASTTSSRWEICNINRRCQLLVIFQFATHLL